MPIGEQIRVPGGKNNLDETFMLHTEASLASCTNYCSFIIAR